MTSSYPYENEAKLAREAEDEAQPGKTAYAVAAEKSGPTVGKELDEEERKRAGSATHRALGAGAGAVYGAMRHRLPAAGLPSWTSHLPPGATGPGVSS